MMNNSFIIIGDVLCAKHIHGISRYAYEIINELDSLVADLDISIIYPDNMEITTNNLKNIKLLPIHVNDHEHFRKNILSKYARNKNCVVIDFGPGYVYYKKSVVTFHDIRALDQKQYDSFKLRFKTWIMLKLAMHSRNTRIVTVSEYQRNRISQICHVNRKRISVVGNGWEHIKRICPDYSIFDRFPKIKGQEYYYALGSMARHKNYKWIYEIAQRNKDLLFVVAGNIDIGTWGIDNSNILLENIVYTGYISDEENVALMENCKAFVHPSKYEGFGIPPLEALALGKNVLASNVTSLPEIFKDSIVYFDPDDYSFDLHAVSWNDTSGREDVLKQHTWKNAAISWNRIIRGMMEDE